MQTLAVRSAVSALIAAVAMVASCSLESHLPPSPESRARTRSDRAAAQLVDHMRSLPWVIAASAVVAFPTDDPLAPTAARPARAALALVVSATADRRAIAITGRSAATTIVGADAIITIDTFAIATAGSRSRSAVAGSLALGLAAAAAACGLWLARRRSLARYRGIKPQ
jgi:hypothetical protein